MGLVKKRIDDYVVSMDAEELLSDIRLGIYDSIRERAIEIMFEERRGVMDSDDVRSAYQDLYGDCFDLDDVLKRFEICDEGSGI